MTLSKLFGRHLLKYLSRRDFLKATGIAVAAAAAGVYEFVPGTKAIVDP
ncbi:MAG: twin-arginine translocation signal domain-containing protein, partial [Megasphaera micronuciformis]|nr:twin-arginine translocation signal domain-containing protein [Megasphaera micronuciformis]